MRWDCGKEGRGGEGREGERGKKKKRENERREGKRKRENILITLNIHALLPIVLLSFEHLGRIGAPLLFDFRGLGRGFFVIFEFVVDGGVGGFALATFGCVIGGGGSFGLGGFVGCCFGSGGGGVGGFEIALDGLESLAVGRGR